MKTIIRSTIFSLIVLGLSASASAQNKPKKLPKTDVVISTRYGEIGIDLYKDTPLHRENFFKLVDAQFYDGTEFHRVIDSFMIQGGDPWSKEPSKQDKLGDGGPGYELKAEIKYPEHFHRRGVVAAARESDSLNPQRKSSGSQFYIVDGRLFPDEKSLEKSRDRVRKWLKDPAFDWTPEQKEVYAKEGGTPWLDGSYTIFGEVVYGMETVDKIAAVKRDEKDRPLEHVTMRIRRGRN